jgi:oxalate decarboxylase/phosphoglucose isomerase-like protein (cupin superfamily)
MKDAIPLYEKTAYVQWIKTEGIPVHHGFGMQDVRELELAPWKRTGGDAAFIQLYGMQGVTGMYVAEIPPGGALNPERHLFEEVICVLQGQGGTEIWNDGGGKQMFEWGPWSLFSPPLNTWHRLVNGGREPVKFLAVTNAPMVFDIYRNGDFVFNCPYAFTDRYVGEQDFFAVGQKRYTLGLQNIWETNFIPDIRKASLQSLELKGAGLRLSQYEMAGNSLIGHIGEWPVGKYHKAHYHGPGAIIVGLQSVGYVILWSKELGTRPYENGYGDKVVEIKWKEASVYCPPANWFHQHFNAGKEPARHLAVRYGSRLHPLGFKVALQRTNDDVYIDINKGGNLIEYKHEDPEIRLRYEESLKATGAVCQMPQVT